MVKGPQQSIDRRVVIASALSSVPFWAAGCGVPVAVPAGQILVNIFVRAAAIIVVDAGTAAVGSLLQRAKKVEGFRERADDESLNRDIDAACALLDSGGANLKAIGVRPNEPVLVTVSAKNTSNSRIYDFPVEIEHIDLIRKVSSAPQWVYFDLAPGEEKHQQRLLPMGTGLLGLNTCIASVQEQPQSDSTLSKTLVAVSQDLLYDLTSQIIEKLLYRRR